MNSNIFNVVYADPPWDICYQTNSRGAINHYPLMTMAQLKAMPISDITSQNSVCFLWICNGMYLEGTEVLKAWGYRLVSDFIWIKPRIGMGHYFRYASEKLLLGVRGKMLPAIKTQPNWGFFPTQEHSHKPEEVHAIIERMYPNAKYLELFARRRPTNPEWYCWGNECPGGSDIYIPDYPVPSYSQRVLAPVNITNTKTNDTEVAIAEAEEGVEKGNSSKSPNDCGLVKGNTSNRRADKAFTIHCIPASGNLAVDYYMKNTMTPITGSNDTNVALARSGTYETNDTNVALANLSVRHKKAESEEK